LRIAVVGSGAMGSLFGGMLAEAGEEVTLVDIWEEHVRAINERGLDKAGRGRLCGPRPHLRQVLRHPEGRG